MSEAAPLQTVFVEEQHLAMRVPQLQLPIRQTEWEHLRSLLRRCKSRERNFDSALWSSVSIAATSLFSTFGFVLVKDPPKWLMYVGIAVTVAAGAVSIVLAIVRRMFQSDKSALIEDALSFMQECERAFPSITETPTKRPEP